MNISNICRLVCGSFMLFYILPVVGQTTNHIILSPPQKITVAADGISVLHEKVANVRAAYTHEILDYILSHHGVEVDYKMIPRLRARQMVQTGEVDCMALANTAIPNVIFTDEPWGYHELKLYVRANDTRFSNIPLEDLSSIDKVLSVGSVGVMRDWRYDGGPVDRFIKEHLDDPLLYGLAGKNALFRNMDMLKRGRIDSFIACPLWVRSQIVDTDLSEEDFKPVANLSPNKIGLYFACSERSKHADFIIRAINETLPLMRESGKLSEILARYGHQDWQ